VPAPHGRRRGATQQRGARAAGCAETAGKSVWEGEQGNTESFKDDAGRGLVPYTEARARWGDGRLYFLLYAGDLDLEGSVKETDGPVEQDDSFRLEFRSEREVRVVSVSLLGTVADALCRQGATGVACDAGWDSHAEVAVDRDGTLNRIGDNDEEWVVEMAIPFSALGILRPAPGTRIPFSIGRCEVGHAGRGKCGSWGKSGIGGVLDPDPITYAPAAEPACQKSRDSVMRVR
jgi:hypothetical protein